MATKKNAGTETVSADEAYAVTTETPAKDDQVSYVVGDAKHEDAPVRTSRPDVPIAASLAAGAGEHKPPNPDEFDSDGRPRGEIKVADNTGLAREGSQALTRETR